jgi:hypothetical protein
MDRVYILEALDYEERYILGVYKTKERAFQEKKRLEQEAIDFEKATAGINHSRILVLNVVSCCFECRARGDYQYIPRNSGFGSNEPCTSIRWKDVTREVKDE